MKKVNWGILSSAKIGREKVIPAMQQGQWSHVGAIASRSLEQAQRVADELGIAKAYGSYDELLADPEIEAIYNPLPNDQHVAMTLAAARAGKHVLCEKPFAMNAAEMEALREVAGQVHIMEAFMVRFHPQWLRARELVRSGELGELRTVQVFFRTSTASPTTSATGLRWVVVRCTTLAATPSSPGAFCLRPNRSVWWHCLTATRNSAPTAR
jgi:predicted dehydrogenase